MRINNAFVLITVLFNTTECNNESTLEPQKSEFTNFFPISQGNKWIYTSSYNEGGINDPTIKIVGEEVIEIIKHHDLSDSFYIQIITNAIKTIETDFKKRDKGSDFELSKNIFLYKIRVYHCGIFT